MDLGPWDPGTLGPSAYKVPAPFFVFLLPSYLSLSLSSIIFSTLLIHTHTASLILFIMRSSIIFLSALATSVMAGNATDTYTFPAGFDIGLVKPGDLCMYLDSSSNNTMLIK